MPSYNGRVEEVGETGRTVALPHILFSGGREEEDGGGGGIPCL